MVVAGWVSVALPSLLVVVMELLLGERDRAWSCWRQRGQVLRWLVEEVGLGFVGEQREGGTRYLGAGHNIGLGQRDWNLDGGCSGGRLAELVGMEWVVTSDTIPV